MARLLRVLRVAIPAAMVVLGGWSMAVGFHTAIGVSVAVVGLALLAWWVAGAVRRHERRASAPANA